MIFLCILLYSLKIRKTHTCLMVNMILLFILDFFFNACMKGSQSMKQPKGYITIHFYLNSDNRLQGEACTARNSE